MPEKINTNLIVQPNWPCPGGNDIQCCVKYEDMVNGTSNSTTPVIPPPTSTESSPSASSTTPPSSSQLSTSDIIALAVGIPTGLATIAGVLVAIKWKRRQPQRGGNGENGE